MISTDPGASLPAKDGGAELLNSSLGNYSEVTLCARFRSHDFSTHPDGAPYQTLISYGTDDLLSSYTATSCEEFFPGCTQKYKERFSKFPHLQWLGGKVFGYLFDSDNTDNTYYTAWWPAVWNTACISLSPSLGYRLNINGHVALEKQDYRHNINGNGNVKVYSNYCDTMASL